MMTICRQLVSIMYVSECRKNKHRSLQKAEQRQKIITKRWGNNVLTQCVHYCQSETGHRGQYGNSRASVLKNAVFDQDKRGMRKNEKTEENKYLEKGRKM